MRFAQQLFAAIDEDWRPGNMPGPMAQQEADRVGHILALDRRGCLRPRRD
ncbi:hypothetical protein FHT77_002729 [Rhizobium sp. BK181]|nr:hypothetical protein [Rhizobium sp. BK181]MBB3316848.1 hypothetical protein [Rhizobium sp. BK181]